MSIWETQLQRNIACGANCKDCGDVITDNPEGEPILCEACYEIASEDYDDFDAWRELEKD